MRERLKAIALVNTATLLWSGNVVIGRALREAVGPMALAGMRAALASVVFYFLLRGNVRKNLSEFDFRGKVTLALMALAGVAAFQVLQYEGLKYTTAVNAGIMNAMGPVAAFILARVFLGEPFGVYHALGTVLGMAGVGMIIGRGSWRVFAAMEFNPGDVLILGAVFIWALYSVLGRAIMRKHKNLTVTALSTMMGALMLAAPTGMEIAEGNIHFSAALFWAVVYIGVGPSCIAFFCWNEGVKQLGAGPASAFLNTMPVYTAVISTMALGEGFGFWALPGTVLVLSGSLIASLAPVRVRHKT